MKRRNKSPYHGISPLVERQMRNWEIARSLKHPAAAPAESGVKDFVTVSRAVGLPGLKIAELLGERLGWPVFVKQILEVMAGEDEYRRRLYAAMDERDTSWLEGIARSMGLGKHGHDDYFRRLTTTILTIARKGNAVFLGRGADLILPLNAGFRVGLTAPREYCLRAYAAQKNLPLDQAAREVEEIQAERNDFIRHHFKIDAADPCRCDAMINMERVSESEIVDMIMAVLRSRGIAP